MQVVILVALWPEARAIARAFHLPERAVLANGLVENKQVRLVLVGPGAHRLRTVRVAPMAGVIMAGLAGGLAPELGVGDVVIQGEHRPLGPFAHKLLAGNLATSSAIVATPADKAALHRQTGAVAVDMETAPAEKWAQEMEVPFLGVRAISDTAREALDPALLTLVDAAGRPRVGRAIGLVLRHPTKLPSLVRIGRATNVALAHLAATLQGLLESGWPAKR